MTAALVTGEGRGYEDAAAEARRRWGGLLDDVGKDAPRRYAEGTALPREAFRRAAEEGLTGYALPPRVGGGGAGPGAWGRTQQELGRLCADPVFPMLVGVQAGIAGVLAAAGDDGLDERWVRPIVAGACVPALAFSEDADLFSMRTRIRPDGAGFRLDGRKEFVGGGLTADVFLVYAAAPGGDLVACLVDAGDPGVRVEPVTGLGFATGASARLLMADVPIAADRIVAPVDGLSHAQRFLNTRRIDIACTVAGQMRTLLDRAVERLRVTERHGRLLIDLPNVQAALGRMSMGVVTAHAVTGHALRHIESGRLQPGFDPVVATAKHQVTAAALALVEEAFRVLGGHAYYGDPHFAMAVREFHGLVAGSGTQEHLEINLGVHAAHTPGGAG
ncbi:acyl-CoA dehydrogenase family protein [Streptomyces sp. NPDC048659]|uniref:acyl-CoA dehydrogenase family protein n=1 Tax=Streptomyces sp. NPDC048659 TaxID=3155489 RepID=UPI00341DD9A9